MCSIVIAFIFITIFKGALLTVSFFAFPLHGKKLFKSKLLMASSKLPEQMNLTK